MTSETLSGLSRRQLLAAGGAAAVTLSVAPSLKAAPLPAPSTGNSIVQIRNATIRVNYAGVRFLVDPMFADPGAYPGFPGSAMSHLRNPLVPLPVAVADLVDADAVIVTHTHIDHWDDAAQKALPKAMPIFVQNATDAATIRGQGFSDVRIMTTDTRFKGVQLARTGGHHGGDAVLRAVPTLDPVSGVVFRHQSHKSVYVVGDTIWDAAVAQAVETYKPDVIVLNAGYAQWVDLGPILMGPQGVLSVHRAAPTAQLVATHMEAINHCVLRRADLAAFAKKEGFAQRLLIPADGENISI
ncbi:MBL fold metallo-hydrolase [Sphingomonas sp. CFBP 13714]|uniref:MBL fold metallo-hydrolase n=1 Tax=Sphingomonas sp. CFBP 13714 TaxID=2775308 RepID=UPI001784D7B5|nr:MBL fold metallo-hydrolase [Sphingomonas sp. CFBP 13714]MBD8701921.1 MBL fold metallo-hydrolase [Sphingomonas sp. CFBP 13714]